MNVPDVYESNCAVISEEGGKLTLNLARRKQPVTVPASWVDLKKRQPDPRNPRSVAAAAKYPFVMKMPGPMARQAGLIE